MLLHEFRACMGKLSDAFDRKEMSDSKADVFFSRFKGLDKEIFDKVVDDIINSEEKFPTISKIYQYKMRYANQEQRKVRDCPQCGGVGAVSARRSGSKEQSYCFRCNLCDNWRGRLADRIPLWPAKGFTLIEGRGINLKGAAFIKSMPKADPETEQVRERAKEKVEREFFNPATGKNEVW